MPEYLAPGVYVEEVSFRSKSIEGVPTSTTGFAGMTRYGPGAVLRAARPTTEPRLITSFTEFERVYGGLEPLHVRPRATSGESLPGARRPGVLPQRRQAALRLARLRPRDPAADSTDCGVASLPSPWPATHCRDLARALARRATATCASTPQPVRSRNVAFQRRRRSARPGAARQAGRGGRDRARAAAGTPPAGNDRPRRWRTSRVVERRRRRHSRRSIARRRRRRPPRRRHHPARRAAGQVQRRRRAHRHLRRARPPHPAQRRYIGKILQARRPGGRERGGLSRLGRRPPPAAATSARRTRWSRCSERRPPAARPAATTALVPAPTTCWARRPTPTTPTSRRPGLEALGEVDDIAIVALPDGGTYDDADRAASRGRPADRPCRDAALPDRGRRRPAEQLDDEIRELPRQIRQQVRRALPPVDRDPRPDSSAPRRARRPAAAAAAVRLRRPASTPAATSSAASTRRRRTRWCTG